jgi:haloacetate dehalogenase
VTCPLLVVWGRHGFIAHRYDPLAVWRDYATDVEGGALETGHFVAEEDPEATVAVLSSWLT